MINLEQNLGICLQEVIYNENIPTSVIKYTLYNEAEKKGILLFPEYEKPVELEDIKRDIKIYVTKTLRSEVTAEELESYVNSYIEIMGNDEILKALS